MIKRMISNKKAEVEDPDQSVNQEVNKIYYESSHPYVLPPQMAIKELESYKIKDLQKAHATMINTRRMSIAVVTSMPIDKVKKTLEKEFGSMKGWHYNKKIVSTLKAPRKMFQKERDILCLYKS